MLAVPATALAHDAAVVRCSACGAPRSGQERGCRYCSSDFTLHERDLDTLCPQCMTRVSGKGRFCHSCATPLLLSQATAAPSEHPCPACGDGTSLSSRRLGSEDAAILECRLCAGLWLEKEVFEVLAARARTGRVPDLPGPVLPAGPAAEPDIAPAARAAGPAAASPAGAAATLVSPAPASQAGMETGAGGARAYRPCAVCGALMNRRNYGRRSGVILDICAEHGIWFDSDELQRLLRWIREGGEEKAQALLAEQERAAARHGKLFPVSWPADEDERVKRTLDSFLLDLLGGVFGRLMPGLFR
ncbi:MAG TPA: zf-TFIIB domain-containing protein [Thermoanaerobaculia bacterium]|nr:zf-TFIIB domain-containing protein [Thermoanaerobaculia bacterium]